MRALNMAINPLHKHISNIEKEKTERLRVRVGDINCNEILTILTASDKLQINYNKYELIIACVKHISKTHTYSHLHTRNQAIKKVGFFVNDFFKISYPVKNISAVILKGAVASRQRLYTMSVFCVVLL